MSLSIVATPMSATANSFVTAAEMTAYCESRLNASAWSAADAQLPALAEATRDLSVLSYLGEKSTADQALSWPRRYVADPDMPVTARNRDFVGELPVDLDADVVPQRVKDATCELALQYLKAGTSDLAAADANVGVVEKSVGPLTTRWSEAQRRPTGLARFPRVLALITPLLDQAPSGALEIARA